jgi:protein tyrosine/serine phosphatase
MSRHLPLTSIENFRDFGGYETRHGRPLKRGVLFRSAHHHHATDEDLAHVARLGPSHIFDLRRLDERTREPCARWDPFTAEVVENDLGHEPDDAWWSKVRASPLTPQWFLDDAEVFYREAPFMERHIDLFRRYFAALAAGAGPVVVHCAAGKDRTGMICALTHHVLGVGREDIVADFLLTNREERIEPRALHLRDLFRREAQVELPLDAARVAVMVHEAHLHAAFAEMERRCGSLDGYLRDALGVDAAVVEALEARLLD